MSDALYLFGGLAVGGAVIGAVVWRNRQAKTEAPSATDGLCAAASKLGLPREACEAGVGIIGTIGNALGGLLSADWAARDAENKRLNGEVEIPLDAELVKRSIQYSQIANSQPGLKGSVIRFKNGGVPFRGAPGWEKCAPGTHSMILRGNTSGGDLVLLPWWWEGKASGTKAPDPQRYRNGEWFSADLLRSYAFSGHPLDPFTRGPLADGSYFVAGRRTAPCAAGQVIEPAYIFAPSPTSVQYRCAPPGRTFREVWPEHAPSGGYRPPSGGASVGTIVTTTGPRDIGSAVVRDHT